MDSLKIFIGIAKNCIIIKEYFTYTKFFHSSFFPPRTLKIFISIDNTGTYFYKSAV
jgi:hypothetical protein